MQAKSATRKQIKIAGVSELATQALAAVDRSHARDKVRAEWSGIPESERPKVRRVMAAFATKIASDPQEAWKQIQKGREHTAKEEAKRLSQAKREQDKRKAEERAAAREIVRDAFGTLGTYDFVLRKMAKGESLLGSGIDEHDAKAVRVLIFHELARMERALVSLGVMPDSSDEEGYFDSRAAQDD